MADQLKTDLALTRRSVGAPSSNRQAVDFQTNRGDVHLSSGLDNLAQAMLNRLYTRRGELAGLGHPTYGSRLYELIGEPITWRTHAKAELYIRECLRQEHRIQQVLEIVLIEGTNRTTLAVNIIVEPVGQEPVQLSFALNLEG